MIKLLLILANLLSPPNPRPLVALTFDDGACTPPGARVVKILDKHQVKATFFPKWKMMDGIKRCERRVLSAYRNGHEFGIHGWDQIDVNFTNGAYRSNEIFPPEHRLRQLLLTDKHIFYRPSSGWTMSPDTKEWFVQAWKEYGGGRPAPIEITWTFTTHDITMWNRGVPGVEAIPKIKRRLAKIFYAKRNHVVLMHDNLPWAPKALGWFLKDKRTSRVEFVTLSEFYGRVLIRLVLKEVGDSLRRLSRIATRF